MDETTRVLATYAATQRFEILPASTVRAAMREKVCREHGLLPGQEDGGAERNDPRPATLCGSPDTVSEAIAEIDRIGSSWYSGSAPCCTRWPRTVFGSS